MEWIINIIANTMDIVIIYYLYCGLTDSLPTIKIRHIGVAILWGLLFGTMITFSRNDIYYLTQQLCRLIFLQLLYRRNIYSTFIILILQYALVVPIQVVIVLLLIPLPMQAALEFIIAQTLTVFVVLYICYKVPLHKLLNKIETELLVKLSFFLFNVICFAIIIFYNLNYEGIRLNLVYFSLLIIFAIFGFAMTIVKIYFFTNRLPFIQHEAKNALVNTYISLINTEDIQSVRESVKIYLETLGMEIPKGNIDTNEDYRDFRSLIEYKRQERMGLKRIVFDTDIKCIEPYTQVPEPAIMNMLAILLDNAIDATPSGKKIKIYIRSTEKIFVIQVSNAYLKGNRSEFFNNLFRKGYSTKENNSQHHGYGLIKLQKMVEKCNGIIVLKNEYEAEEKAKYLFIRIEFSQ